jgi:hypothetical protein
LGLKWPGSPHESSQVIPSDVGEEKHYDATFTDRRSPDTIVPYSAFVIDFPEKALKGKAPRDFLNAYVFASQKHETARKEVELGRCKHPCLEITTHSGDLFDRRLVVMAGPRLYEVSVSSRKEQALRDVQVKKFFESLVIEP